LRLLAVLDVMHALKERLKPDTTFRIAYDDRNEDLDEPRYIVAYWSIRGLGAPLAMMLTAARVNHWVIFYDTNEEGDDGWNEDSYNEDKAWLRDEVNPLMNLPFLVDCSTDRVIVQSNAIFCYLGRELNMLGKTPLEQSMCEELLFQVTDLRDQMVDFAYEASTEDDKEEAANLASEASNCYAKLEAYLKKKYETMMVGKNNSADEPDGLICHLVGDDYSAPDFHLYEMLDQFEGLVQFYDLEPLLLGSRYPHLAAYKIAFESLPEVSVYLNSRAREVPYNSCSARFGSDPSTRGMYKRGMETPWKKQGVVDELRSKMNEK
jgi:glutathione S-transferase